jgi:hypothetical protein
MVSSLIPPWRQKVDICPVMSKRLVQGQLLGIPPIADIAEQGLSMPGDPRETRPL